MRSKIARFAHNKEAENLLQEGKLLFEKVKGNWQKEFFRDQQPITIELACGRGEYTLGLARLFPDRNFIGVDIKGDRLWKGSSLAIQEGLTNVGFLRTFIHDLNNYFDIDEIDEIWLTFPDPRPKEREEKRRLTSKRFIESYKDILKPDGWFKFKTDNTELFDYTLAELAKRSDIDSLVYTYDLSDSEMLADHFDIRTRYEQLFVEKGEKVKYLKFKFIS
jgi:tRNA (guanine-N7-)-methyltransferase